MRREVASRQATVPRDQLAPRDTVKIMTLGAGMGNPAATPWLSLRSHGARRWYFGGMFGLLWLASTVIGVVPELEGAASSIGFVVVVVLFAGFFLAIPPINWALPVRFRLVLPTALLAFSFAFWPWLGIDVYTLWVYVGVCAGMSAVPFRITIGYIAALTALSAWFAWMAGEALWFPAITASVSLMMAAFGRLIGTVNQLRATQEEMAGLAVREERSRVARDMHDILGHSLTVITVKAELAGRLLETDPDGAAKEIAEVEDLARGALADVRSTIAGYRGVSILSELANARTALESSGIEVTLPASVDVVPANRRELFGWVVREGVTNVVRHSQATHCTVELGTDFVQVTDDGRGFSGNPGGSGLVGLGERVAAAGGTMTAQNLAGGGFRLKVVTS